MCLIVTTLFLVLTFWALMQKDFTAAALYASIALLFGALMVWNIKKTWKSRHKT
ncbi:MULTISPECIES: hypothetical protein [Nitratiruptor]|uniref:Uncharacterized protein n=1 Tax=Nitratiruptor tergarcus DSM 16512 TaxID=1069081 RepID=A0A1W1WSE4_9BACT|nr:MULTISPECIES: hypothetical protein [Nitratiruptor]BCD61803.1 hypothetical protein NitYY0813_C0664 [Nitratiruptor sp. YY08-13]BCD65738.1 hypothetical protein NitYY0826_C0666 [Nitratiruptor sp. YY08-26]SMC09231.1 hypothetical protein SAMN05660197_1037 [Nitratiruptor tergarcus DSM 16512]